MGAAALARKAMAKEKPTSRPTFGLRVYYRHDEANWCPGCSRSSWYVGRLLAECAFCGTAIPIAHNSKGERCWTF